MSTTLVLQQPWSEPDEPASPLEGPALGRFPLVARDGFTPVHRILRGSEPTAGSSPSTPASSIAASEAATTAELVRVLHNWIVDIAPSELGRADGRGAGRGQVPGVPE